MHRARTAHHRIAVAALLAGLIMLAAPMLGATGDGDVASEAPPGPRIEIRPSAPGPAHAWIPGRWQWSGDGYTWSSGRWTPTPSPTAT